MVKKTEEKINPDQKNDVFGVWTENYTGFLKMWGDSHLKLYRPWVECMGEMSEKAALISHDAMPEKYREFYDEWVKVYQHRFGKLYPLSRQSSGKETLEKLLNSAEESSRLYRSWIAELEENSKKTQELIKGEPDPAKYKECYDIWMKSYEKMMDDMLELPAMVQTGEMFGEYTGIPDAFSETHKQISKLWKDLHARMYRPWIEYIAKLSEKAAEISKGKASPEDYREFYNMWMDTYRDYFGRVFDSSSARTSKEAYEDFLQNASTYVNMYKSWVAAIEKMSEKSRELSLTASPESYREFCDLWIKMYEKAFDSFFDDMPMIGPMKETMEPVKIAARAYTDANIKMARAWAESNFKPASRT